METLATLWKAYIKAIYSILMNGHIDKNGCVFIGHQTRIRHELMYYMAFGAVIPSFPIVFIIKEISLLIGIEHWAFVGFLAYFLITLIVGMGIQKHVDGTPVNKIYMEH